ncbi:MAG: ribosomal RNA small subunit methyltransferase A [Candidatus Nealsonbacteria bacterium RIFCSPLOWO2_01_FULL_38_120]|nr:MAG: ribosomal RNA small subunit methyltransferase A [Candidatus Nealsonbacteria bacterium RIFCSPLOWO2_01_FULL_38_120]
MKLSYREDIRNVLKKSGAKPSKRFGQNFLTSEKKIKEIVEAANIKPDDIVIEIGPGVGNLTQELAKKAKKIIAIEKDGNMVKIIKETLKDYKNTEIIQADILKINTTGACPVTPDIISDKYKVVANLPFYIATAIIKKFIEAKNQPELMILTVQKEVGQRICASPPNMSLLAISVQFYAEAKIISYIPKKLFWPSPKVDSAIIIVKPRIDTDIKQINTDIKRTDTDIKQANKDLFFKIVKAGFSQPRKQLANNLTKNLNLNPLVGIELDKKQIEGWLLKNSIKPCQRAETLSLENWISLAKSLPY